mgnify:FL=1
MMNATTNPLVQQILDQAKAKAADILAKAKKTADSILAESEEEAEKQCAQERHSFELKLDSVNQYEASAKRNVDRIAELKAMDSAYDEVVSQIRLQFQSMSCTAEFRSTLVSWIAESAIGLDKKEAKVAFFAKCPVDESMLRDAEQMVFNSTGAKVSLCLDSQRCRDIGVILSSMDGQVSFDNELDVRLRRYQKDIRKIVQEENARQNNR